MMDGSSLPIRSTPGLLCAIAGELDAVHARLEHLQALVGKAMAEVPSLTHQWSELQGLDRSTQSLAALSVFLRAMRDALPADCAIEIEPALREIPLGDLQRLLSGEHAVSRPVAAESFELF